MARRHAGAEAPQPDQAFCERAPLLAHLRSGYALPTSRQQRQIPILIEVRFSPQILAPRGGHYWTRKGVAIGSDLTVEGLLSRGAPGRIRTSDPQIRSLMLVKASAWSRQRRPAGRPFARKRGR